MTRKSQSKYPRALRDYVQARHASGARPKVIHGEVIKRWPEFSHIGPNTIYMMIGSFRQRLGMTSGQISLPGPEWSIPDGCVPVGNSWEQAA